MALSADSQLKYIITSKENGGHTPLYSVKWSWCSQQISTAELIVKNKWRLKDFLCQKQLNLTKGSSAALQVRGKVGHLP